MSIKIQNVGSDMLKVYASIPISFKVETFFRIEAIDKGLGGFKILEETVAPYIKNYDNQIYDDEKGPVDWPKHFDISNWGIFMAFDGLNPLGGATVAFNTPNVNMLESRKDLAVLWDIRVHPDKRRNGIGSMLFKHAVDWAKSKGCRQF